MRITELILILLISNLTFGQDKYVGIYKDRFSETIELKSDSTFIHNYTFDLSSSWTTGKWKVSNDTIYLKSELVSDSLQIRDSEGKSIKDSLVLSADLKINRIELNDFIMSALWSGGQNKVKPPKKLYWKRKKLYRINNDKTLDLRKVKAFWSDKKYETYFRKETE
ncbi:hypothetical protein ACU8DI_14970 [Psychroserpens sp. BH13MA-6]